MVCSFSCTKQGYRSANEMIAEASDIFKDYIFEFAIKESLFTGPHIENRDGITSYKWTIVTKDKKIIGLEVLVARDRKVKPELIRIGSVDEWFPYVGSKHEKNPVPKQ